MASTDTQYLSSVPGPDGRAGLAGLRDLGGLAGKLREKPVIVDAEVMAGPGPGEVTALIVPQGYRPPPVLRDLVSKLAGEAGRATEPGLDGDDVQAAIVLRIPRREDGTLDEPAAREAIAKTGLMLRYEQPATEFERSLGELIEEVLPQVRVSMNDDLISLGGDSLTAVELVELITERWGIDISPEELFAAELVRDMAAVIARYASGKA